MSALEGVTLGPWQSSREFSYIMGDGVVIAIVYPNGCAIVLVPGAHVYDVTFPSVAEAQSTTEQALVSLGAIRAESVRDPVRDPQARELFVDSDDSFWLVTFRDGKRIDYSCFGADIVHLSDWESVVDRRGMRAATAAEVSDFRILYMPFGGVK